MYVAFGEKDIKYKEIKHNTKGIRAALVSIATASCQPQECLLLLELPHKSASATASPAKPLLDTCGDPGALI